MALEDSFFVGMLNQDDFRHKETEQLMPNVNSVEQDKWIVPLQINGAVIPQAGHRGQSQLNE